MVWVTKQHVLKSKFLYIIQECNHMIFMLYNVLNKLGCQLSAFWVYQHYGITTSFCGFGWQDMLLLYACYVMFVCLQLHMQGNIVQQLLFLYICQNTILKNSKAINYKYKEPENKEISPRKSFFVAGFMLEIDFQYVSVIRKQTHFIVIFKNLQTLENVFEHHNITCLNIHFISTNIQEAQGP